MSPQSPCVTELVASIDTAINTAAGIHCLQGFTITGSQLVVCQYSNCCRLSAAAAAASAGLWWNCQSVVCWFPCSAAKLSTEVRLYRFTELL